MHTRNQNLIVTDTYAEVSFEAILRLHRHQDGYIAFATERDEDDFRPLVSIRASDLKTCLPLYRDQFLKNSYCSINADWRLKSYGKHGASYGYPLHSRDRLRYINACYVDLDYYTLGLDLETVIARVIDLQASGQLPVASMIVTSGRGIWLLWLIGHPNSLQHPVGAFADKLDLYDRVQHRIIERLLPLGADRAACDAARHIRLPGSLHAGSENTVKWWMQGGGSPCIYTLPQLADIFSVAPTRRLVRRIIAHSAAKRHGWDALNARRLHDFKTLRALRGGFVEGCRNNAAKIYAWLLRCNRTPTPELADSIRLLAVDCRPRLPINAVKDAVNYSKTMRRMKDQTIADWLKITNSEAELLKGLPPATGFGATNNPKRAPMARALRRRAMSERHAAIQALVTELSNVPTVREMSKLINSRGFKGNHQTVFKDYRTLRITSERSKKPKLPSLPLHATESRQAEPGELPVPPLPMSRPDLRDHTG